MNMRPAPNIDTHMHTHTYTDAHTYIYIYTYIHTYIHLCLLVLILMNGQHGSDIESKGHVLSASAEYRIRTPGLWNRILSRLNARWQTDWAIEDQVKHLTSIARPYDERAFSHFDFTASWLSKLALSIYVFVVIWCSGTGKRFSNRNETSCPPRLNVGFEHI